MPTNIDTGLTVQDAVAADHSPHIFTMSNGDLLAIYYDGTNLVWRSKSAGTWSASNTITLDTGVAPANVGYFTRNGDVIFGIVSKDPIDATHNGDSLELTYTPATHTLAVTNKSLDAADGNEKAAGIGYISGATANNQVQMLHGNAAGNFGTVQQLNVNPTIVGTDQSPTFGDYRSSARTGVVTDGTTTTYLIYAMSSTGTAFKVERFVTSINGDNVETPPAPAANLAGVTAVYDGTNYVFIANENNAKLRYLTRTGTNTYGTWTDILSDASLVGEPAVCVKASTGDLALFYRTNKNQANGEIWVVERTSGTWGTPALLAGGATTGWSHPSCAASDLNDTGIARVVYVTGTASTWTLVEDAYTFGAAGGGTVNGSATLASNSAISEAAHVVSTSAPVASNSAMAEAAQLVTSSAPVVSNSALTEAAQIIATAAPVTSNSALSVTAQIITASTTAQSNSTLAEAAQVVNPSAVVQSNSILAAVGHIETPPPTLISNSGLSVTAQIVSTSTPVVSNSAVAQAAQIIGALVALASTSVLVATGVSQGQTQPGTVTLADAAVGTVTLVDALAATVTLSDSIVVLGSVTLTDALAATVTLADAAVGVVTISDSPVGAS